MNSDFAREFKEALIEMIPKSHDDYITLQYSDQIHVQVWSHDDGAGHFEIYAIIPHDSVNDVPDESQLSPDIPTVEEFYSDIDQLLAEEIDGDFSDLVFFLAEVVANGAWERDATVYSTHKLSADGWM